jgi:acetolactate synthase-1/2/3 large subunit
MKAKRDNIDKPIQSQHTQAFGSDYMAQMLRRLGYKYVAINPGSSFRGLHDSIVNDLQNRDPSFLLCLHEEHAVSIAHGWGKVTREPMAVILHSNVGLMHGSMAVYNAWCDRVPISIFGATGPLDACKRRPWIDWIHTSRDQGSLVRAFTKWDDEPTSLQASLDSMARAFFISKTVPQGPTYVCFDVTVQEAPVEVSPSLPDPSVFTAPRVPGVSLQDLEQLTEMLEAANNPIFLMGRLPICEANWRNRISLAEFFNAKVVTDIKTNISFPTSHPNSVGAPGFFLSEESIDAIRESDLIVSFDWIDLGTSLKLVQDGIGVVHISQDHHLVNGWSMDHMGPVSADLHIAAQPETVIDELCCKLNIPDSAFIVPDKAIKEIPENNGLLTMDLLAHCLNTSFKDQLVTYVRLPLGWNGSYTPFNDPFAYLGYDGGAGIGSGLGMLIGASLALEDSGRIPVGVLGDGDTMMGISALWTGAKYKVPFIAIVCNNRSYFNDEVHQEKVAITRGRPVENKAIGQAISEPDLDFAALAKAQGVTGIGPVTDAGSLQTAIAKAIGLFKSGKPVLIEAVIKPEYAKEMAKGMTS